MATTSFDAPRVGRIGVIALASPTAAQLRAALHATARSCGFDDVVVLASRGPELAELLGMCAAAGQKLCVVGQRRNGAAQGPGGQSAVWSELAASSDAACVFYNGVTHGSTVRTMRRDVARRVR